MISKLIVLPYLFATSQARYIEIERRADGFRIINGSNARPGEFPYEVSLQENFIDNSQHYCDGANISDQWILTVAHYLVDHYWFFDYTVVVGTRNIRSFKESVQTIPQGSTFPHAKFTSNDSLYDIALIKLKYPLKFNNSTAPISLPKKDSEPIGSVILAGWGRIQNDSDAERPGTLQKADFEIVDRKTCKESIDKLLKEDGKNPKDYVVDETNICTSPLTGGLGPCDRDSGGPLINKDENGKSVIVGITSWTMRPCGRKGSPTIYTKVSSYIDWIENIMANN